MDIYKRGSGLYIDDLHGICKKMKTLKDVKEGPVDPHVTSTVVLSTLNYKGMNYREFYYKGGMSFY